jgi:hypothetical protein
MMKLVLFGLLACLVLPLMAHASPFGINGTSWSHLGANTGNFNREQGLKRLEAMKEAGITWDRCDFWWGRIEPEKGRFVYDDFDWVIEQYRQSGIQLMPILCYFSAWSDHHAPVTDEERQLFARYVYNTVSRYRNVVKFWEIWNEPNINEFWHPTPNARDYYELLKVSYEAAKRADPDCIVVGASTAGTDFAFIDELLTHGGGQFMDVISVHPYQGDLGSLSPDAGGLEPTMRGLRMLLAEHGVDIPIWITEMGHRTPGGEGHTHVTEQQQAAYLVRSYVLAQAAGVERLFWFNLQDWSERWGIIDMDFNRKPSHTAYRHMTEMLGGRRVVGTLDLGEQVAAYVYAPPGRRISARDAVLVAWSRDDELRPIELPGRRAQRWDGPVQSGSDFTLGGTPVFVTQLNIDTINAIHPLPPEPPLNERPSEPLQEPQLPRRPAAWHIPEARHRFPIAISVHQPLDTDDVVSVPADQLPPEARDHHHFTVIEPAQEREKRPAQRDLDGNLVFIAPAPASPDTQRTFYLYTTDQIPDSPLRATETELANTLLTVHFADRTHATHIELNSGYTTGRHELGRLFTVSYEDTEGRWPRSDRDVEVLAHEHVAGPVLAQYRSRVAFGHNRAEHEFTFTVYRDLPRISHLSHWISPGTGATKQVSLGSSFPPGTQIIGQYGSATLPTSAASYGRAAVIRPADHPTATGVLVAPQGQLNTPGWATHSIVATGLFYHTIFPHQSTAEYFWYEQIPAGDLTQVARTHHRRIAHPPIIVTGPLERR